MNDEHFESAKKYAFHLHVMKFDFIGALGAYEAALEVCVCVCVCLLDFFFFFYENYNNVNVF
jgi:hypothetical protein